MLGGSLRPAHVLEADIGIALLKVGMGLISGTTDILLCTEWGLYTAAGDLILFCTTLMLFGAIGIIMGRTLPIFFFFLTQHVI